MIRHEESRVREAWSLAWVPVGGMLLFSWWGCHFFQGCWAPLPWGTHSALMSPFTLMARLMNLSLAGIAGCHRQLLGTYPQGLSEPSSLSSGEWFGTWCWASSGVAPQLCQGTGARLPRHSEPFLTSGSGTQRAVASPRKQLGSYWLGCSQRFSELLHGAWRVLGFGSCTSGKFAWSALLYAWPYAGL